MTIEIAKLGAELKSIVDNKTGIEYLWQADPTYWGRSAPILFPIVGRLKDDKYVVNDTTYRLPQHGFARDSMFNIVENRNDLTLFELRANLETKKTYPFDFSLKVDYRLEENRIETTYTVVNNGNGLMYFSIGSHPAFNIPFGDGTYTDYFIEFEKNEPLRRCGLQDGLQSAEPQRVLAQNKTIPLTDKLFDRGALVFKGLQSKNISLKNKLDAREIIVSAPGTPFLGIWSKPDCAPFICIEPWFGIADSVNSDHDLSKKEGILSLPPDQAFKTTYSITVQTK
ncbi:MAG: aldose 1-epimerase family protein [Proteobacteria bacterium]|nr:aldose 1-epimerase family protein [Pseudomonadota bacterium]